MKKNINVLVMFLIVFVTLSGCAQMKDKFVPKPKEETTARRFNVVREYNVHPDLELYTKRYVFWKSWHKELLSVLMDSNHKKTVVAAEQELSNLFSMYRMLQDEKGDQLMVLIDEFEGIEKKIKRERITQGNVVRIRRRLETIGRQVRKDFSYNKIRGFLRDDFRQKQQ